MADVHEFAEVLSESLLFQVTEEDRADDKLSLLYPSDALTNTHRIMMKTLGLVDEELEEYEEVFEDMRQAADIAYQGLLTRFEHIESAAISANSRRRRMFGLLRQRPAFGTANTGNLWRRCLDAAEQPLTEDEIGAAVDVLNGELVRHGNGAEM